MGGSHWTQKGPVGKPAGSACQNSLPSGSRRIPFVNNSVKKELRCQRILHPRRTPSNCSSRSRLRTTSTSLYRLFVYGPTIQRWASPTFDSAAKSATGVSSSTTGWRAAGTRAANLFGTTPPLSLRGVDTCALRSGVEMLRSISPSTTGAFLGVGLSVDTARLGCYCATTLSRRPSTGPSRACGKGPVV
jgi:hypothetical protein